MILRPESDEFDWSWAAVALLAMLFCILLAYAIWKADRIEAASSGGAARTISEGTNSSLLIKGVSER